MKLSEIFEEKPEQWGLRGDPYFWDYLKEAAKDTETLSPDELEEWIRKEHLSLSGEEMTDESMVKIERFAHGGMSSGGVCGDWWTKTGIPLLRSRLNREPSALINIQYGRKSVCAGDDVTAGNCNIKMPEDATLGELMNTVLCGGRGNERPIPFTGTYSYWVIKSNADDLAKIYTDGSGGWHVECVFDAETPLRDMKIEWIFGDRD